MTSIRQLLFIVIVTNAGGQGKTTLARVIKTLLELAEEPVQLLDSDAGNAAAKVIDASAKKIGWGVDTIVAPEIVADCEGQHVVLDLGANALASAREIALLLPELCKLFAAAGYRNIAFLPVTPNKPGATEAVLHLADQLPAMDKIFVRNDIDNSGQFEVLPANVNVVDLEHLAPGIMAYVNEGGLTFREAIQSPASDREKAARMIAKWLRNFASATARYGCFLKSGMRLQAFPAPDGHVSFSIKTAAMATDRALANNQQKSRVLALLNAHGWDAQGLRKAADEL
ncbi:hypothetical protein AAG614_03810 [Citromicrobium bathyomarinum]